MVKDILHLYDVGTHLFYAPDDEAGLDEAKRYCNDNALTINDVKIVRKENSIFVVKK